MQTFGSFHRTLVLVAFALAGCSRGGGFDAGPADLGANFDARADALRSDGREQDDASAQFDAAAEVARADAARAEVATDAYDVYEASTDSNAEPEGDVPPLCRPPLGTCTAPSDCCSMDCNGGRCACVPWQAPCTFDAACCSGRCNLPTMQCLCGDLGTRCADDPECCGTLVCARGICSR